ncbi:glycoside hydrolase family 27 protein [Sediminibacterium sp.]|uniref:glycoside hydrolase family 27 protein n=1 Tax=Sediminibacterium sp. TaxID=1917865 RepID=UPI003F7041BC
MKKGIIILFSCLLIDISYAQPSTLAPKPLMGWMSWNFFAEKVNEQELKEMATAMIRTGMVEAGYNYIFIDDGWQGGRDMKNNIIANPIKFPSGIKALASFMHERGLKLGIYSDAAQLTCAGFTASLHFEEQDAKTFAEWGIDYLKYDYCNAPADSNTAKIRYQKMAEALKKTGRPIVLGICEWGERKPWHWAAAVGGQIWRTTHDIRDKWVKKPDEKWGLGILDILETNATLSNFAGPGRWNDADMLVVGLYGKKGPSGDGGGIGCSDLEYQSQFSLWSIMCSPLYASNDIRTMNKASQSILLNKEVIAINQDPLGIQAERKMNDSIWSVFVKPLVNGEYAIAILNKSNQSVPFSLNLKEMGLDEQFQIRDLWEHQLVKQSDLNQFLILSHQTKLYRLTRKNKNK